MHIIAETITLLSRASAGQKPSPTRKVKVKKSETIRRKSTFASCAEVSPSVVRMSWSVDFVSCSVDFMSRPVDFVSPFAPILESTPFDITHDKSSIYGIRNSGSRSKSRDFGPQKPEKHPKKRFWSVRNCDLRRFRTTKRTLNLSPKRGTTGKLSRDTHFLREPHYASHSLCAVAPHGVRNDCTR